MVYLGDLDIDVFTEYLRNKYKDRTIEVLWITTTNAANTVMVDYYSEVIRKERNSPYTSFSEEVNYCDLWMTVRTLKLKRLKEKIYVNKF
jgi:hypothetical protein